MKTIRFATVLITLVVFIDILQLNGQDTPSSQIEFKNAPVLFKESNKSFQQIIANYSSENPGKIVFSIAGKELLRADLNKGNNKFLLTFPTVTKPTKIIISAKIDNRATDKYAVTLIPPKKWKIYFVQHTHTDIGYTRPQSEMLAEHMRFIDYALDYCDQTDDMPDDAKFRWTCESAWVVMEYLHSRPASQIKRFKKRISEGRIEVTGMYSNMAEIFDVSMMYDFLRPLKEINQIGIPVKTAMQNDVNGVAWCMPDYFKNTGVKYLSMGINTTRGGQPFNIPTCFWWESPSGERMLAFRGNGYITGNILGLEGNNTIKWDALTGKAIFPTLGIERKPIKFAENLLWHLADLESKNYPFDRIAILFSGCNTDNAPPSIAACDIVEQWNAKYEFPKLRLAVASEFFEYIENKYADQLPIYRNAWPDWWTDGLGTSSRETAEVRKVQNLKQVADGLFAMVSMMGGELSPELEGKMNHVSESALFFCEHTWGAGESIRNPFSENTTRQWLQKSAYAWEALKKVALLNEEALGRFQEFLKKVDFPIIYIINSMGWNRSGTVELFIDYDVLPVHKNVNIIDLSSGKKVPAQILRKRGSCAYWMLEVNDIPAMGYKVLKIELTDQSEPEKTQAQTSVETLENKYFKLMIDKNTGAISSLFDKELGQELADVENPWKIGQLVRETLQNRENRKPSYSTVSNIKIEKGTDNAIWESIRILSDMTGFEKGDENAPKGLELEIRLYKNVKKIELKYMAHKEILTDPEALYVAFPFSLPDSRIVFETIGGTLTQGQQLRGSSSDWNAAQNFVSVRGSKGQIIVVSKEIPLWQFGDFNISKFGHYPKSGKTWLYSWVMNNYWTTNWRAFQEGGFSWTYQITSTTDTTNTYASKYAWSERNPFLTRTFPAGANELKSPTLETLKIVGPSNVMLVNSRPVFKNKGTILLHFRELEGLSSEVKLSSSITGRPVRKMMEVNTIGKQIGQPLISVRFKPYEVRFIEVEF
jgi:alpha-mannosidase